MSLRKVDTLTAQKVEVLVEALSDLSAQCVTTSKAEVKVRKEVEKSAKVQLIVKRQKNTISLNAGGKASKLFSDACQPWNCVYFKLPKTDKEK